MDKQTFKQALQKYFSRRGQLAWHERRRRLEARKQALLARATEVRLRELTSEVRHYEESAIALWYEAGRISQLSAEAVWKEFWGDESEADAAELP